MASSIKRSDCNSVITFKTILIGDSGVGKSALIQKYVKGSLMSSFNATVGVDFSSKTLRVQGNNVQLQIWDTSGQDVYRSVTSNFYRGASVVFLVYAMDNRASFEHLPSWIEEFYEKGSKEAFLFIVGTKSDLPNPQVSSQQAQELMSNYEGAFYIQTSVKEGNSVRTLFERAAESIYKLYTISPAFKELVDNERLVRSKISSLKSSVISLQSTRSQIFMQPKKRQCCH